MSPCLNNAKHSKKGAGHGENSYDAVAYRFSHGCSLVGSLDQGYEGFVSRDVT